MDKLLKTFWRDNRNFFLIITLVFTVMTTLFPLSILILEQISTKSILFGYIDTSAILLIMLLIALWIVRGLMVPGFAIFLSVRTQTGLAKQRYQMISASRWKFGIIQIATILLATLLYSLIAILIISLLGLVFGANVLEAFNGKDVGMVLNVLYNDFNFDSFMIIPVGIIKIINTFLFWQLIFVLPQTKALKALPKAGMVFTIIGGYLGLYFLQFVVFLTTIFNQMNSFTTISNISTTVTCLIGLGLYFYTLEQQVEI